MEAEATLRAIPAGNAFLDWFADFPTFHDAEIVGVDLSRDRPGKLVLHTWKIGELRADGYFAREKRCAVTFVLTDVFDLDLRGFGSQNVIGSMSIVPREFSDAEICTLPLRAGGRGYELNIEPCFGLSGTIRCIDLSLDFIPTP